MESFWQQGRLWSFWNHENFEPIWIEKSFEMWKVSLHLIVDLEEFYFRKNKTEESLE